MRELGKAYKVLTDLCTEREYCIIPGIHTLLRPKQSQDVPKGGTLLFILVSHGEWVDMRDFIRLARPRKNTCLLVSLIALDTISKIETL
jgi:hypothetical protein